MIVGLILAAGSSQRFGKDKRAQLAVGTETMLESVLAQFTAALPKVFVVIRPNDDFGQAACKRFKASVLVNVDHLQGMGHSLSVGIAALAGISEIKGVVVGLADMPWINAGTIDYIARHLDQLAKPVVPTFQGKPGHPRGIPAALFGSLTNLTGDEGARNAIDWANAERVEVDCPGIVWDVDTPDELHSFQRQSNTNV